jgi:two-component system, cell cycle sensor histidine kinase and response regulator CckA
MSDTIPGSKGKILLMDDDDIVLDITRKMMESFGYQVDSAKEGQEAVERYARAAEESLPYDAVILDMTVQGGFGGLEAIRRLQRLNPEVKAVISSGYAEDPVLRNYTQYGFVGMIAKPFRLNKLRALLEELFKK